MALNSALGSWLLKVYQAVILTLDSSISLPVIIGVTLDKSHYLFGLQGVWEGSQNRSGSWTRLRVLISFGISHFPLMT